MTGGEPTRALGSAYVLYERIGRGASGDVWRGLDSRTGAPVAVKVLRPVLAHQGEIVEALLRERTILMRLHDPHIVRLRDLVVESDTVALVTDFAAGGDLRSRLAGGPLPVLESLDILSQLLDGLDAAHRRGVVHRDLKPENVLVEGHDDDMLVRITDFGIATLVGATESSDPLSLVGSPEYMAPEVIEARRTTPAADLYSAGILLYELLTGHTPFTGGAPVAVLRKHIHEVPSRIPGLRDDLWELIDALLAKDPADRPPSARAVARRVRAIADDVAGVERPDPRLDDLDVDEPPGDSLVIADWDIRSDEDTTVVGARRGAARRRRRWTAAIIVLVVVGAGTAIGAIALNRHRKATVPHTSLTGVPGLRAGDTSDAVVTRTLDLSGNAGDRLTVRLHITNVGDSRLGKIYEPQLGTDNLLPFTVNLAPQQSTMITYRLPIERGAVDINRLLDLERKFGSVHGAVLGALATAHAEPQLLPLRPGQRAFLNVSGLTTTGAKASAELLSGLEWSSSNPRVADVTSGGSGRPVISAHRSGSALITASLGLETLDIHVGVGGGSAPPSSAPCEPGVGESEALTQISDDTYIRAGAGWWVILGGARLPLAQAAPANAANLPVPTETLGAIATVPRSGTKLRDKNGSTWQILAGALTPVPASDVPADVPRTDLGGIPIFSRSLGLFTDGALVRSLQSPTVWRYLDNTWTQVSNACNPTTVPALPANLNDLPQ